ncbi:MAG: hypothetical protein U5K69_14225 [Balneolaceae bacterium]|nr:hypothetical protein [Balneolaceae bacterium]
MAITEQDLKNIFGAEKTETTPNKEELEFLDKRSQIEEDTFPLLSIEQYEYNYERFCEYGLEEKMLEKVEPHVRYLSRFEPHKLLESRFYKRFKDEKIVQRYVEENINLKKHTSDE